MAIDPSWDNFTNKLMPVRRVSRLVVWNTLMKEQAIDLHGYQPDEIRLAGVPQWDRYFTPGVTISRDDFFRRIGADPARRLARRRAVCNGESSLSAADRTACDRLHRPARR